MAALQTTKKGGELSWSRYNIWGESFELLSAHARLVTSLGALQVVDSGGQEPRVLGGQPLGCTALAIKLNGHVHPRAAPY